MKRLFVSSTFKDFQLERDCIRNKIYPYLNEKLKDYKMYFSFQDLRWGIDTDSLTENEASKKVIGFCLEEVRRSKPCFIIMLGNKYGYRAGAKIVKSEANKQGLELEDYDISMTELEIRYALSILEDDSHLFIYFRNGQDDDPKMIKLKENLKNRFSNKIRYYSTLDEFSKLMASELFAVLKNDFDMLTDANSAILEQQRMQNYYKDKALYFSARNDDFNNVRDLINYNARNVIMVTGESGSGKSTLLSALANSYNNVLFYECGFTNVTSKALNIMKSIVEYLKAVYSINYDGNITTVVDYQNFLAQVDLNLKERVYIFIDGFDQLSDDKFKKGKLVFIPGLNNIVFIGSIIDNNESYPVDFKKYKLKELVNADKRNIAVSLLRRLGKELNDDVLTRIMENTGSNNPLFLETLIAYISFFDKDDFKIINEDYKADFVRYELELLDSIPNDLEQMEILLVRKICEKIPYCTFYLDLMSLSYRGLSMERLEALDALRNAPFDKVSFLTAVNIVPEFFFVRDDGEYDFFHQSMKRALKQYNKSNPAYVSLKRALAQCFLGGECSIEEGVYYGYQLGHLESVLVMIGSNLPLGINALIECVALDDESLIEAMCNVVNQNINISIVDVVKLINKISASLFLYLDYKDPFEGEIANRILTNLTHAYEELFANYLTECKLEDNKINNRIATPFNELLNVQMCFGDKESINSCQKAIDYITRIAEKFDTNENYINVLKRELEWLKSSFGGGGNYIEELQKALSNFDESNDNINYLTEYARLFAEYGQSLLSENPGDAPTVYPYLEKSFELRQRICDRLNIMGREVDPNNIYELDFYAKGLVILVMCIAYLKNPPLEKSKEYLKKSELTIALMKPYIKTKDLFDSYVGLLFACYYFNVINAEYDNASYYLWQYFKVNVENENKVSFYSIAIARAINAIAQFGDKLKQDVCKNILSVFIDLNIPAFDPRDQQRLFKFIYDIFTNSDFSVELRIIVYPIIKRSLLPEINNDAGRQTLVKVFEIFDDLLTDQYYQEKLDNFSILIENLVGNKDYVSSYNNAITRYFELVCRDIKNYSGKSINIISRILEADAKNVESGDVDALELIKHDYRIINYYKNNYMNLDDDKYTTMYQLLINNPGSFDRLMDEFNMSSFVLYNMMDFFIDNGTLQRNKDGKIINIIYKLIESKHKAFIDKELNESEYRMLCKLVYVYLQMLENGKDFISSDTLVLYTACDIIRKKYYEKYYFNKIEEEFMQARVKVFAKVLKYKK